MGAIASFTCESCGYDSGELTLGIPPDPKRYDPVLVSCPKCKRLDSVHRPKIKKGCTKCKETKQKIFTSFYSTKGSRGTGLGLLVTSKIVMEHGGRIFFNSEEGIGTKFTILLPTGEPHGKHALGHVRPDPGNAQIQNGEAAFEST